MTLFPLLISVSANLLSFCNYLWDSRLTVQDIFALNVIYFLYTVVQCFNVAQGRLTLISTQTASEL